MEKYGFIRMLFNKGNTLYDYVTVRVYVYTCARAACIVRDRLTSAQARAELLRVRYDFQCIIVIAIFRKGRISVHKTVKDRV